jgi:hypothetical protein
MKSHNLRPAASGTVTGHGTVRMQSLDDHPATGDLQEVPGTGEVGPSAADSQVILPAPAAPGQLPPDRPGPDEPAAQSPPVPAELPRRKADPSRPSVPTGRSRWPGSAPAAEPPAQSRRPGPPGDASPQEPSSTGLPIAQPSSTEPSSTEPSSTEPSSTEPSSPPLPPELFHRLWWQERPGPAGPSHPSPEPGQPGPAPSAPRPPAEPSRGAMHAARVRLWLRRWLARAKRP